MGSINQAIVVGRVGRDPEIRTIQQSGDLVASFQVATNESWMKDGERQQATEWHNVVVFDQNAVKVVDDYVKKGSQVGVTGKLETRKWQDQQGNDRYSTEIVVRGGRGRVELLDTNGSDGQSSGGRNSDRRGPSPR